jgi:hypothetical protein
MFEQIPDVKPSAYVKGGLIGLAVALLIWWAVADFAYQFAHPETTKAQRIINIVDVMLFR